MNLEFFKKPTILFLTLIFVFSIPCIFAQESQPGSSEEDNNSLFTREAMPSSQKPEDEYKKQQQDLKEYLSILDSLKNATLQERIQGWEQFLEDNPDSAYKSEVRENLNNLRAVVRMDEEKKLDKELKDKKVYENLKEQTKTLPLNDQIAKYEEFINSNPDNSQLDTVKKDLKALKDSQAKVTQAQQPQAGPTGQPGAPVAPLTPAGQTKDPNHALFMATVPGLFVPGIGSFYAGDTTTGVVLVAVRLAGLGMIAGGAVRKSNGLIITGALAAGFSYLIDIAASPIIAREHNEKLEKKASYELYPFITLANNRPAFGLSVNF